MAEAGGSGGSGIDTGLAYKGIVTAVPAANRYTVPQFIGLGIGKLIGVTNPYALFIFRKGTGTGLAPQGEIQNVTAYNSVTGEVTAAGYTVAVTVGDEVMLVHPSIANAVAMTGGLGTILTAITQTTGLCYQGTVTAVPGVNQFTIPTLAGLGAVKFIDTGLVNQYYAFVLRDAGGAGAAPQGESQPITNYATLTGNFSANAFTVPVNIGDEILIIHPFLARIMNLVGLPTATGSQTKNWQAAEQDLVTIGAANVSYKLHLVLVSIANLIGNITIRAYHSIAGTERRIFPIPAATVFTAAASAPGIPVIDTTMAITEALRITIQSDNAADNGQAVDYEYKLEAM
jgi:hypothetical protein